MHLFDQSNKQYFIFTQISCGNWFLNHLNSRILSYSCGYEDSDNAEKNTKLASASNVYFYLFVNYIFANCSLHSQHEALKKIFKIVILKIIKKKKVDLIILNKKMNIIIVNFFIVLDIKKIAYHFYMGILSLDISLINSCHP